MAIYLKPARVATICTVIAVVLGAAHCVVEYYHLRVAPHRLEAAKRQADWPADPELAAKRTADIENPRGMVHQFDLDNEDNLGNTYSVLQLFCASLVLVLIASDSAKRGDGLQRYWKVLAAIFVLLALDEGSSLHNQLHVFSGSEAEHKQRGIFYFSWIIPAGIVAALYGISQIRFLWKLPSATRWLMLISGAWYIASAVGGEMAEGRWLAHGNYKGSAYQLMVLLEECGEMLSITLFIWVLLTYAARMQLATSICAGDRHPVEHA